MWESFWQLLFPERCAACDALAAAPGLCAGCTPSLYPLGAACPLCAVPVEAAAPVVCRRCRAQPPPFARVIAPFRYGGELAQALRRFKYGGARAGGRPELGRALGALLAPSLAAAPVGLVAPVPLHPARLRERGFSQTHVLVGAAGGKPWHGLRRSRPTAVQAGLGRAARRANVRGAFTCAPLAGERVLLVDDVVTTGATVAECARTLRAAGASEVVVLALARAEG